MPKLPVFIFFAVFAPCMIGCGLFESSKPYKFQEAPPYYQSEKQDMVDAAKIHRQSQLSRLEEDAKVLDVEKKHEEEIAARNAEKKEKKGKSWTERWFGKGDETFMMSSEARKINANLER